MNDPMSNQLRTARCASCPYNRVTIVTGEEIYPNFPELHAKFFHLCECGAYVGCHPGTNKPLGTCADAVLRRWRIQTHRALDDLWKKKGFGRTDVYRALGRSMGLGTSKCHIGRFDRHQCQKALQLLRDGVVERNLHDMN